MVVKGKKKMKGEREREKKKNIYKISGKRNGKKLWTLSAESSHFSPAQIKLGKQLGSPHKRARDNTN